MAFQALSITESTIAKHSAKSLGAWLYLKLRCSNSVVYFGYDERRANKTGWGRSKFFRTMQGLCEDGLAVRVSQGHYRLANTSVIKAGAKHACTIELERGASEQECRDMLHVLLVEMAHRQRIRHESPPTPKELAKRERVRLLEMTPEQRSAETMMVGQPPILGQSKQVLEESAKEGWAPMNTEKLMKVTGLGRAALFAWKVRAKQRGWLRQKNRWQHVPIHVAAGFPKHIRSAEVRCLGKVSVWGSGYRFHQASTYQLTRR